MEDLAAEAGVSKGTLYSYFKDKEELYRALLARAAKQYLDQLAQETADTPEPRERLVAVVQSLLTFFDDQPHVFDLIQRVEMLSSTPAGFPWQQVRDHL